MNEMMKQCCGEDGMPDMEMMKQFMERCGKDVFTDDDMQKMQQFCCQEGMPDMAKMMQMMESCGCRVSEASE